MSRPEGRGGLRPWSRLMAAGYDRLTAPMERGFMGEWRAALLGPLHGDVLEIGGGTGANLAHYDLGTIGSLTVTEPDPFMARRLAARLPAKVGLETVGAHHLPFDDGSFDGVVCTLVLCSVVDPEAVFGEVARVLRPGGRLHFVEHVRSDSPRMAAWQDRLDRVWAGCCGGCHANRRTPAMMAAAGFDVTLEDSLTLSRRAGLVRDFVRGRAGLAMGA